MSSIRKSYTIAQKLKVVQCTTTQTKKQVSISCNIPLSLVYKWCKEKDVLSTRNKRTRKHGSGRKPLYRDIEEQLYSTIQKQRHEQGICISLANIQQQMRILVNSDFKASHSWGKGFMKRFDLVLRKPTVYVAANKWSSEYKPNSISTDHIAKISAYHEYYDKVIGKNDYDDDYIINVDETPVYFDNIYRKTIDCAKNRDVVVKTTGNVRDRVTTVLAVTKSGKMLPPCIIEKGTSKDAINDQSKTRYQVDGINIWKQPSKTMTSNIMVDWIEKYLAPLFDRNKRKLLIMDSFSGHKTQAVKDTLERYNIDVAMIPGGCTKYLQPLDISVNRSFKCKLKDQYKHQVAQVGEKITTREKLKFLVDGVVNSANMITSDCIINGFKSMLNSKTLV